MTAIATVLTALVALIHVYIVVLEMALWDTPRGRAAFGTSRELAAQTKVLAANQGLYNGFLVAGLAARPGRPGGPPARLRGLHAVLRGRRRGVYGAVTASRRILWVQALPAALALAAQVLAH